MYSIVDQMKSIICRSTPFAGAVMFLAVFMAIPQSSRGQDSGGGHPKQTAVHHRNYRHSHGSISDQTKKRSSAVVAVEGIPSFTK